MREGDTLVRTATHPDFAAALGWVVRVGLIAEKVDHHPDIDVRYNQVTLRLWTHTTGGITTSDVDLAWGFRLGSGRNRSLNVKSALSWKDWTC
ncbi:4a-hydroxytetrahydrobiopterin dehydratase [Acrocarpospora catenulata]|uniref:4a-hydroxytetrahydrobiopterin dehydratase n=1 Tax=Acrocarpospora catenulata TaxID=2836182 RepID=UPI001BDB4A02